MKYQIRRVLVKVKYDALIALGFIVFGPFLLVEKVSKFIDKKKEERIKKSRKVVWITAD